MSSNRTAGVVMPPPAVFGLAAAFGYVLTLFVPLGWPTAVLAFAEPAGWILGGAGLCTIAWAVAQFADAGTPIQPHHPTTALVTSGPYRLSRNPIYVALVAITLGAALIANMPWIAAMLIPAVVVLHAGVIRREEAYLETLFGDDYRAYTARVRRYL